MHWKDTSDLSPFEGMAAASVVTGPPGAGPKAEPMRRHAPPAFAGESVRQGAITKTTHQYPGV